MKGSSLILIAGLGLGAYWLYSQNKETGGGFFGSGDVVPSGGTPYGTESPASFNFGFPDPAFPSDSPSKKAVLTQGEAPSGSGYARAMSTGGTSFFYDTGGQVVGAESESRKMSLTAAAAKKELMTGQSRQDVPFVTLGNQAMANKQNQSAERADVLKKIKAVAAKVKK